MDWDAEFDNARDKACEQFIVNDNFNTFHTWTTREFTAGADWAKPMLMEAVEALELYQKWQTGITAKGSWADKALAKLRKKLEEE